jgi:hypothetical protein
MAPFASGGVTEISSVTPALTQTLPLPNDPTGRCRRLFHVIGIID